MKKIKLLFVIMIVTFCCTGCGNSDVTRALRHSGFSLSENVFDCDALIPKRDKEYEAIKYLGNNYVITTNGVIHEISYGKKFSNEKHCKRADTELNVMAIIGEQVFKAKDNRIYYLKGSQGVAYTEVPFSDSSYHIYRYFFDDPEIIKVQLVGNSSYYVLKSNGNVYNYVLQQNRGAINLISMNTVYSTDTVGGEIIDFNYAGDSSEATFVRTANNIFRNAALNRDECQKYVDVPCNYEFAQDALLSQYMDRMIAYNGKTIITDYLKVFNLGGGE